MSYNLGDRTAAWLYDRLTEACIEPPGIGHLEDPKLTSDLTTAREFDLGMTGPALVHLDGLHRRRDGRDRHRVRLGRRAGVLSWWAALLLGGAWLATHWWLRESAVWQDRNTEVVRSAQRDADYMYRLAVDPPAAKEVRLFGLSSWILDTFLNRRRTLHSLQYEATRLREKPVISSLLLVTAANLVVFWSLASGGLSGRLGLGDVVLYSLLAIGTSSIAFGGLSWALDGAAAPVAAVLRLQHAMAPAGELSRGTRPRRADSRAGDSIPRCDLCLSWRRGGVGSV